MTASVHKKTTFSFYQAIQVLELTYREELSPHTASMLAILFTKLDEQDHIFIIRDWICKYIEPFLYSEPRDQSDLRDKTLAIATYYLVEDASDSDHILPNEFLNRYVDFASKQDWYDDSLLAFSFGLLQNRDISNKVGDFFSENFSNFISNKDIQAISQALYLSSNIDDGYKKIGVDFLKSVVNDPSTQFFDKSWGLIGLANLDNQNKEIQEQISNEINNEIFNTTTSYLSSILSNKIESANVNFAEFCLETVSLLLSRRYYNLSISGIDEESIYELIKFENNKESGYIQISKQANIIGNILAILVTLLIGLFIVTYLYGIKFNANNLISTTTPDLGDLLIIPIWLDYLVSQIQALFYGQSALEGMKEIPLIRHIVNSGKKKERL